MRIVSLKADNIKKLTAVEITPTGDLIQITGANASGKSSVLECIWFALAGKSVLPTRPIREGEERAYIRLDLGEVIVTRKFARQDDGEITTSLLVESTNGAVFPSPQKMLDKLVGSLSFDPLAFSRASAKEQLEQLRQLVPVAIDLDAIDADNDRDFRARTEANRTVKLLTGKVAELREGFMPEMDVAPIDTAPLVAQLEAIGRGNAGLERAAAEVQQLHQRAEWTRQQLDNKRALIAQLTDEVAKLDGTLADIGTQVNERSELPEPTDPMPIRNQIAAAQGESRAREQQIAVRQRLAAVEKEREDASTQADKLTKAMEYRAKQKAEAIAAVRFPVEGLSFGSGEVLYNGIPFAQASHAERLRVSIALAMAANPTLRVLRVEDGSLLDEANLALLAEMAKDQDYQVWLERATSDGRIGIFIEDGAVAAIDGVPVEEAATVGAE